MLQFHASGIGSFSEFEETLLVHFDDGADHYLEFQVPVEGFEEDVEGFRMVYVVVDDQINSGSDCLTEAELRRGSFRISFDNRVPRLARIKTVEVTFDLGAEDFAQLRAALGRVFRKFAAYRDMADECGGAQGHSPTYFAKGRIP